MKLYLCSYRITQKDALLALAGKSATQLKTALIPNAKDYYAPRARAVKIRETAEYLTSEGFSVYKLDLLSFTNISTLQSELEKYDLLWVMGGNTYNLREAMRRSRFDEIIKNVLVSEKIVYAGESAGAVAAGTNLHGIEAADNPEFAEEIIYDGLHLTEHFILPHADNPTFAESNEQAREYHKHDKSIIELTDQQAFIIDGRTEEVLPI
jgi:dipeptidase E